MNLSTDYLGLKLRSPLVPSASPLSERLDYIKRMEDAGAGAVVLHSLFEELIRQAQHEAFPVLTPGGEDFTESLRNLQRSGAVALNPDNYLEEIAAAKRAVAIPVIASLNGSTRGGWTRYAREIEQAGADAVELNIYWIPTDSALSGAEVESRYLEIVRSVKSAVDLPVAVKVSPFFSNFGNMAQRFVESGARGLVLFNRFYQPDVDPEAAAVKPEIELSTSIAMRLPLRWIGILYGRVQASLAATSGIHEAADVIKMLMVGADVTLLCSVLLRKGIGHLQTLEREVSEWMEAHGYDSIQQFKGSLSQAHSPDPGAFERVQYVRGITTAWKGSPD
jgi:dihydroorotate dehydrogenase (fumarate)